MSLKEYLKIISISLPLLATPMISYANSFDDLIRNTQERIENAQENIGRKYDDERRKVEESLKGVDGVVKERGNEYIQNLDGIIKSKELQSNIERVMNYRPNEDDIIRAIEFQRKFNNQLQNTELNLIRNIPVYDPRDGRVKTYDSLLRDMVQQNGGLEGSDVYNDPVKFGFFIMLGDSNYILNSKIIKTDSGFMSINEAYQNKIISESSFLKLTGDYRKMQESYSSENVESLNSYTNNFVNDLNRINSSDNKKDGLNDLENLINKIIDSDLIKELKEKSSFNKPNLREFLEVSTQIFYNTKEMYREIHSYLDKLYKKNGVNKEDSPLAADLTLFGLPGLYFFLKINKFRKRRKEKPIDKLANGEINLEKYFSLYNKNKILK